MKCDSRAYLLGQQSVSGWGLQPRFQEYIIRVQRGISVENSWQIVRRYSDFDLLNNSLQIAGLSLPLPPKKLIGNMDREFIAERQKGLQNYLNVITTNHILSNCELVKKFLDPN
ncbi:PXK isoform 14, partial [Pan troglodytes]